MGCHFLLQGIFLTQGSTQGLNPHHLCLLHWSADSLPLSHLGKDASGTCSPNRVIMMAPQPYQWCWSPFFYKSDLQTLCINQRRERRGRLKLIEGSKNKLTGKHLLIFKTEKVARYLWNYRCRIYYKRVRSADSRALLFIETEQSAGVGWVPWSGGDPGQEGPGLAGIQK